jgi:hypothetical protein
MTDDDDDELADFIQQAKDAAGKMARSALATGKDIDWCVRKARENELRAVDRGNRHIALWWETIGTTLHHRQKFSDEALCQSIEDAGLVDGVWPDDAAQALDLNDGPEL